MSAVTLWTMDKTVALTGERRHLHKGAAVAPLFIAPKLAPQIQFGPTALAAAIARTATLLPASPELLAHLAASALTRLIREAWRIRPRSGSRALALGF